MISIYCFSLVFYCLYIVLFVRNLINSTFLGINISESAFSRYTHLYFSFYRVLLLSLISEDRAKNALQK